MYFSCSDLSSSVCGSAGYTCSRPCRTHTVNTCNKMYVHYLSFILINKLITCTKILHILTFTYIYYIFLDDNVLTDQRSTSTSPDQIDIPKLTTTTPALRKIDHVTQGLNTKTEKGKFITETVILITRCTILYFNIYTMN